MTLKDVNKRFIYKLDIEQFRVKELWTGLQEVDGKLVGDCEDYCITLKRNVKEFKDYEYYYCKLNGIGHCILYKNGNVIDCNIKSVVTLGHYLKIYGMTELKKYNWFVVFSKIVFGKGYLWIKSFKN